MKGENMKYLLLIVLLVAVMLTTGCVSYRGFCGGQIITSEGQECCGGTTVYNTQYQKCCGGTTVYNYTPIFDHPFVFKQTCCEGKVYSTNYDCCRIMRNGTFIEKVYDNGNQSCCYADEYYDTATIKVYDTNTQKCCCGEIREGSEGGCCPGPNPFPNSNWYCNTNICQWWLADNSCGGSLDNPSSCAAIAHQEIIRQNRRF
jgi:hypothetical protein